MIRGARTAPSDSNPASVEESAAAEQQHHEDDDDQSGRVHFLSRVFGERGPASSRPLNARDERRRFGALAVRITPTPTWLDDLDWCVVLGSGRLAGPSC